MSSSFPDIISFKLYNSPCFTDIITNNYMKCFELTRVSRIGGELQELEKKANFLNLSRLNDFGSRDYF